MRTSAWVIACLAVLCGCPALAAAPASKDTTASVIARGLKERHSRPPKDAAVKFVVGNDFWQPGQQFHPGSAWLALECRARGCALKPAALNVKPGFWQGHYDDKPTFGQHLSFSVVGSEPKSVVAWFSTDPPRPWLKPGPVPTYYSPQRKLEQPRNGGAADATVALPGGGSAMLMLRLATKAYLDRVQPGVEHDSPMPLLLLRIRDTRQLLPGEFVECWGGLSASQYLLWSGDLDGDGKPDFLISYIDQEGPIYLYLSSAARPGALVGTAGVYDTPPFGGECDGGPDYTNLKVLDEN